MTPLEEVLASRHSEKLLEDLKPKSGNGLSKFRSETYPNLRNKFAQTALALGGIHTDPKSKRDLHEGNSYQLTKALSNAGMPMDLAGYLTDGVGLANETLTGAMAVPSGRPFFSPYGFGISDLLLNKEGIDRAKTELQREDIDSRPSEQEIRKRLQGMGAPVDSISVW